MSRSTATQQPVAQESGVGPAPGADTLGNAWLTAARLEVEMGRALKVLRGAAVLIEEADDLVGNPGRRLNLVNAAGPSLDQSLILLDHIHNCIGRLANELRTDPVEFHSGRPEASGATEGHEAHAAAHHVPAGRAAENDLDAGGVGGGDFSVASALSTLGNLPEHLLRQVRLNGPGTLADAAAQAVEQVFAIIPNEKRSTREKANMVYSLWDRGFWRGIPSDEAEAREAVRA